jgi:cobalamin biosynthesis protein CobD/CbiB
MKYNNEIIRKYDLYKQAKKMIVSFGIITTIMLFGYMVMAKAGIKACSILMLVLSIISFVIFLVLWIALRPMKKHILSLIEEYKK